MDNEQVLTQSNEIRLDVLKYLYMVFKSNMIPLEDALTYDRTKLFYAWIKKKIQKGELIRIQFRGEVVGGKSIGAMTLMADQIFPALVQHVGIKTPDMYTRIVSDQVEFLRFFKNKERDTCVVTDENDATAEGGLNSSTESQIQESISDIFAQRFVHQLDCSPRKTINPNTHVIIQVMDINKETATNTYQLIYRDPIDQIEITIGYIKIDVTNTLKADWYRKYRVKKFKRMDLLDTHGVRNIRELEFSMLIINTYNKLRKQAMIGAVNPNMVGLFMNKQARDMNMQNSEMAKMVHISQVKALLDPITEMAKNDKRIVKLKEAMKKKYDENTENQYIITLEGNQEMSKLHQEMITEEHKKIKIYNDYMNIK